MDKGSENIIEYMPPELWAHILYFHNNTNLVYVLLYLGKNNTINTNNKNRYNINTEFLKKCYIKNIIFNNTSSKTIYKIYNNINSINTWKKYMYYKNIINSNFSSGNIDKNYNTLIKNYLLINFLKEKINLEKNKKKFYNLVNLLIKHSKPHFIQSDFTKKEIIIYKNNLNKYFDSIII